MSNDDNILFILFIFVLIFAIFIFSQIDEREKQDDWELFFEGNPFSEEVIFPNGEEGKNFLGHYGTKIFVVTPRKESISPQFEIVEEKLTIFLDDNLVAATSENSSWKILVFPDEEKFVVYQRR